MTVRRRKLMLAIGTVAVAAPFATLAQQPGKVWRIGYLDLGTRQSTVDSGRFSALLQGLREVRYVEGGNLVLEARFADGNTDQLIGFAAELVRQNVDLIVSTGTPPSHALKKTTATIPVVITTIIDPVADGFAVSLAKPGGNFTGMSSGAEDTVRKLVELLIVTAPKLKRIAVLTNPRNSSHAALLAQVHAAAKATGRQVLPVSAGGAEDLEAGFATMAREKADALVILIDGQMFLQRSRIAALALKHRLPSIYSQPQYAEAGGLMSYGADTVDNFRRAGIFVHKILKGAKPGDIPFEQPTRYYTVINRNTADALGIKLNNELLVRADKVIQ